MRDNRVSHGPNTDKECAAGWRRTVCTCDSSADCDTNDSETEADAKPAEPDVSSVASPTIDAGLVIGLIRDRFEDIVRICIYGVVLTPIGGVERRRFRLNHGGGTSVAPVWSRPWASLGAAGTALKRPQGDRRIARMGDAPLHLVNPFEKWRPCRARFAVPRSFLSFPRPDTSAPLSFSPRCSRLSSSSHPATRLSPRLI